MPPAIALQPLSPVQRLRLLFGRRRVRTTAITCTLVAAFFSLSWESTLLSLWTRVFGIGFGLMLVFGLFEQWPRRLPRWMARWALQVFMVGLAVPFIVALAYWLSTDAGAPPFYKVGKRLSGFFAMTMMGVLLAPWVALSSLVRQREAWVSEQALAFELERSELARQALDARMRLLSAQVQPHFLFNTLANIQALVETGSARAPAVLQSLIDYLRAAVPRLDEAGHRLGQELEMVRAYLDLMQLRMPDRLQVRIEAEPGVERLHCPPLTLLTLVENAVRHGIDPSEDGGRIELLLKREDGRCRVTVLDTGVGLRASSQGLGTGLKTLRERLQLVFDGEVQLQLHAVQPHGVRVELSFPALEIAA
jgi:signal transduction histidine kinase